MYVIAQSKTPIFIFVITKNMITIIYRNIEKIAVTIKKFRYKHSKYNLFFHKINKIQFSLYLPLICQRNSNYILNVWLN